MQLEDGAELAGNLARLSWTAVGRPAVRGVTVYRGGGVARPDAQVDSIPSSDRDVG